MVSTDYTIWMGAILTIFVYTYVYKENIAYRWAEHTLIGLTAGVYATYGIDTIRTRVFEPVFSGSASSIINLIPFILGILLFTRYARSYSYLSRFMSAMLIAAAIGAGMISSSQTRILKAIEATIPTFSGDMISIISEITLLVAVLTTVAFFTFTREHKGSYGKIAIIGRFLIMVALGANFGNAFSTRLGYIIGRMNFLLIEWLQIAA